MMPTATNSHTCYFEAGMIVSTGLISLVLGVLSHPGRIFMNLNVLRIAFVRAYTNAACECITWKVVLFTYVARAL